MKEVIQQLRGREILNARGKPTVEAELLTSSASTVTASVPSGTSTGKYEAFELYDGGSRYEGYGTRKAAANISGEINDCLRGVALEDLRAIDQRICALDGTPNKSRLGGNALLAVSMAAARAGAAAAGVPLYRWLAGERRKLRMPDLTATVIAGGAFSFSGLAFEDYILVLSGFERFSDELEALVAIRRQLERDVRAKYGDFWEDGGAIAAPIASDGEAFGFMLEAARKAGFEANAALGLDVASSQMYSPEDDLYRFGKLPPQNREQLLETYLGLCREYPLRLIEDGFHEDDFEGSGMLKAAAPSIQVVGDDLFATNLARIRRGIQHDSANTLLLKMNQAGTITEAMDAGRFAQENGYDVIVSLRSGETTDDFAADLAVAVGARQIKAGSPVRAERNAKYNRLLKIQAQLEA